MRGLRPRLTLSYVLFFTALLSFIGLFFSETLRRINQNQVRTMLARRVFRGTFLMGSVPKRMVQFVRRSPRFHDVMQDLFAGTQPYLELKSRLLRNLHGTLFEAVLNFISNRIVPGET